MWFFIFILVIMGNCLIWANETGFKITKLSCSHLFYPITKYHSIPAYFFLNQTVSGFFIRKRLGIRKYYAPYMFAAYENSKYF